MSKKVKDLSKEEIKELFCQEYACAICPLNIGGFKKICIGEILTILNKEIEVIKE